MGAHLGTAGARGEDGRMHRLACTILLGVGLAFAFAGMAACSDDDKVSSEAEARQAYFGLDRAIDRALNLGMAGFNAAHSANIPDQTGTGDITGMLVVSGQVDQGASNNKEMRLKTAFTMYQDRLTGADA